jgi:proline iminopeptidase
MTPPPRTEGYVDVGPGRVWYERAGEASRALLLLHGGPGGNSEDLRPLMELAGDDLVVVRYDQLWLWRSDCPDDLSLWTVPRFVAEVETVRRSLGLGKIHLLGQSWGAILALEYALHHQENLTSLSLGERRRQRRRVRRRDGRLAGGAAGGDAGDPGPPRGGRGVRPPRLQGGDGRPLRPPLLPSEAAARTADDGDRPMGGPVYGVMWGPNEFTCTGTLRSWDRSDRLGEIRVPTLITVGEFDEVRPSCSETMHAASPVRAWRSSRGAPTRSTASSLSGFGRWSGGFWTGWMGWRDREHQACSVPNALTPRPPLPIHGSGTADGRQPSDAVSRRVAAAFMLPLPVRGRAAGGDDSVDDGVALPP